ncbi:hypothetical protein BKA56DRAFT_611442 [Ilyonectria sp. MPI-CAGE-AT-0026]|nr:hypothetical protein BKA56DRAFT_611442 [Ilyonectria sp. MPI-CAGE-AT-0026]
MAGCCHLMQERFFTSGPEKIKPDVTIVPIRIAIRSESGIENWDMSGRELIVPAPGNGLFKLNIDHSGFFRNSYPPVGLKSLMQFVKSDQLPRLQSVVLRPQSSGARTNRIRELLDFFFGTRPMNSNVIQEIIYGNLRAI